MAMMTGVGGVQECDTRCYPGASCWPHVEKMLELYARLPGKVLSSYDEDYRNHVLMINTRVTKLPYLIVMAKTVEDIQFAVQFANKYNMKITIRSSGHDYIGRSTWDGSLQINLSNMTDLKFNLSSSRHAAGEVTAQSGNTWLRVYNETNKLGRVVVGGSAHTVSMGGYTLGGGHSPISRKFGLAVDNLLEVEMVTANGSLIYADEHGTRLWDSHTQVFYQTSNTDIFWAVRGGGGSTYGIVTAFTYKLHYDSKMVTLTCYSPVFDSQGHDVGRPFLQTFNNLLPSLAPEWGGYEIITQGSDPKQGTLGTILLVLNHFGPYGSSSFNTIAPFRSEIEKHCLLKNVSNFLEYEITAHDDLYTRNYIYNTLMQPDSFTPEWYNFMYSMMTDPALEQIKTGVGCTGVLVGGNMKNFADDSTAVNPNLRSAVMALTCGLTWESPFTDSKSIEMAEKFTTGLIKFGNGTYFNEPSAYLPDWKTAYWGGHYDRLFAIKKVWDPENVFTCLHCVGSDISQNLASHGEGDLQSVLPFIHPPIVVG